MISFSHIWFKVLLFYVYCSKRYVFWFLKVTLCMAFLKLIHSISWKKKTNPHVSRLFKEELFCCMGLVCFLYIICDKRSVSFSRRRPLLKIDKVRFPHVWGICIAMKRFPKCHAYLSHITSSCVIPTLKKSPSSRHFNLPILPKNSFWKYYLLHHETNYGRGEKWSRQNV